ncbi:MAG: FUSC family protein [Mycobacterium sp.]
MKAGLASRLSLPYLSEATRSLLGVLIVAVIALQWVSPGAALAAGGSAAIAGAVALQDSPHGRAQLVVAVSVAMGFAVLFGMLSAPITVVFVVMVALWCFAAGTMWAVGANAGLVAAAASALLITATPSGSVGAAFEAAALAVAGGFGQVLLVAIWPRRRWRAQRDALARAYRSVAADARRLVADPDAQFDAEPLIWLRKAFTLTEHQARRRPAPFRGYYGLPERVAMTLATLRKAERDDSHVLTAVASSADMLDALAVGGRSAQLVVAAALRNVDGAVASMKDNAAGVGQRLSAQLHEACALRFGDYRPAGVEELRRPAPHEAVALAIAAVRSELHRGSPLFRHAVRLAGATAIATALARILDMPHGNWIALTVLMVLRPETAHTYTRCVARVGGNLVGVVAATAITLAWHPTGVDAAVLAVLFLAVAYAMSGTSYVALSTALAAAIIFVLDVQATADFDVLSDRVLATLLGGVLAVLAHLLIPDQAMVRLRQRSAELLKAEIDYAAMVIDAYVHELVNRSDALRSAWHRAARARTAFEAACGAVRVDSRDVRRRLAPYRATLNAVTGVCAVLETHLAGLPSPQVDRRFAVAVDDYAEALRGDPPSAGYLWTIDTAHLTETDQQLREAAGLLGPDNAAERILVSQTATITRHLLRIAPDFADR